MLDKKIFNIVVRSTPLISIDLIIKKGDMILLGKRVNKPARDYLFSPGGRIYKNEKISNAIIRISNDELGFSLKTDPKFLGVFEHFYNDGIFENVSTHYVNLAYELEIDGPLSLPTDQHDEYQWLTIDDLLKSELVHQYVKDYFEH